MATAAPDLKPIREPSITDAFDIGQVDRLIELVKELADSPGKEILPNGKRRKDALLQVRYAAAVLHDFDRFDQTASFIYSDNNLELFLKEILYALPRLRQELLNAQGAAPESTTQEVVERAEQIAQETQEGGEKKHRYHDIHELLKENISRAKIHALLNKQREQVILEHLETTEALTARLTSHIEATKAHVANTILSQTNFMEQLVPLLPQGEADQARYFLAEYLSGGIQDELVNTNVILRSDVSPGKIKVGMLKALEASPEGEAIARYLDANPQSLDLLSRTIIENHAEELAKAARYSRSIGRIFESVGGDRLETLIQETQGHLGEEILDEIRKTLGIDPSKILTTKHLGNDIQKIIEESAALAGRDADVQRVILKRFLLDNQRLYPFLRTQRDIDALVANMAKRSSKLASYLASAKRLQRLGYSKGLASENTFLLGSIREEDFPRQLLLLLGDWKHLSVGDVTLRIDAFFNKRKHRDLLLTLLSLDEKTLTALKAEYLTMRGFPQNTKEFWRALKILSYIEQVESFKKELVKNPLLSRKLWNFWRNNLPESTKGKNFRPFLKNLLEVGAPNYYNGGFSQKVFTRGDQPYAGPSVTSPSFAYISNFLTNVSSIEKRWQSRIFSTDIVYRKGLPKLTSQLKTRVNRVLSKGVLGGIKRGLQGLATRLGIGTLLGGIAGALAGIVAGPLLKHWKKIALGIVGGGLYLLSQLLGSLANVIGVAGGTLAGGVIGFIITGGNPLGFVAGAAISGAIHAFIYINFGGWGGAFSALGTTVSGFLTGLQLSAAGLAAGTTAAIGGIFTSVIGVATAATIAIVGIGTFILTLTTTLSTNQPVPVNAQSDVAPVKVTITGPSQLIANRDATYTIQVEGVVAPGKNVVVSTEIPQETQLVNASNTPSVGGNTVTWALAPAPVPEKDVEFSISTYQPGTLQAPNASFADGTQWDPSSIDYEVNVFSLRDPSFAEVGAIAVQLPSDNPIVPKTNDFRNQPKIVLPGFLDGVDWPVSIHDNFGICNSNYNNLIDIALPRDNAIRDGIKARIIDEAKKQGRYLGTLKDLNRPPLTFTYFTNTGCNGKQGSQDSREVLLLKVINGVSAVNQTLQITIRPIQDDNYITLNAKATIDGIIGDFGNSLLIKVGNPPQRKLLDVVDCPIPGQRINCGSYRSAKENNLNTCAVGPPYGHCGKGYGGGCSPASRRAKAIDLEGKEGTPIYLPTIRGKSLTWTYKGVLFTVASGDGGGAARGFQAIDETGTIWSLYLMHVKANDPPLTNNESLPSGNIGAKTGGKIDGVKSFEHVHVNIGTNIRGFGTDVDVSDPGWKSPDTDLGMCIYRR